MIFTEKMRKVELLLLKRDINRVLEYLGLERCFQVSDTVEKEKSEQFYTYQDLLHRLKSSMEFLQLPGTVQGIPKKEIHVPTETDLELSNIILEKNFSFIGKRKDSTGTKVVARIHLTGSKNFPADEFSLERIGECYLSGVSVR